MDLHQKILDAGVVGAGGAGFPTHIKANSKVDYVLANGAECEPLVHKDVNFMINFAPEIIDGMNLMIDSTGAKKGYFGVKTKNWRAIEAVEKSLSNGRIEMTSLGDFYPSGDEYELVYEATKRLMPPHGIPLDVGCVVNNVETLYNISQAEKGNPVTKKFMSVSGLVKKPSSFFVPIGITFREVLEHAGGPVQNDFAVFVGGLLMGRLTFDLDEIVTKTTAALIVLPKDHYLVNRMNRDLHSMNRIGKSACDQCTYCTEFCPRYLLGYDVQPHKVMRSLVFTTSGAELWNKFADLCCSCGLCSLYACPEDLYPREACDQSKVEMRSQGVKYEQTKEVKVHPMKEGRRVPLKQLMKKLNVTDFDSETPYNEEMPKAERVIILTKQHTGAPCKPVVSEGDPVKKGGLVAEPEEGKLGAKIHASIDGIVKEVTPEYILITAK